VDVEIAAFDPDRARGEDLTEFYETARSVYLADFPDRPFSPYDSFVSQLRMPTSHNGRRRVWVARRQGHVVGTATAEFPESENRQHAITAVKVRPELRRHGIGTGLLEAILPDLRAAGRSTVTGVALRSGGDGETWALGAGFAKVEEIALQILNVEDAAPDLWHVSAPAGFRAQAWTGGAPATLIEGCAGALQAMTDAPTEESTLMVPEWTVGRVRAMETEVLGRGCELRTVVAVHEDSGTVAALTNMETRPMRPDVGLQLYTTVLPGFRGRGLGRFVKATMMRALLAEKPRIRQVMTNSDLGNTYMIRVNKQLGYCVDHVVCSVEGDADDLASTLAATGP
jgi:mycothiol synthase